MNMTALRDLPVEQRLHLVEELWDSIAADQGALALTGSQRHELDKRLDAYEMDRDPGQPLEDVLASILNSGVRFHRSRTVHVALFKDSETSFLRSLDEAGITYETRPAAPGAVMAAGTMINIAQGLVATGPLAAVLVAWLRARASRKVIVTRRDKQIVQLEGYGVEEVKKLLPLVDHLAVIDTKPEGKI